MSQSFFIWKGTDCRAKGIRLSGPVSIVRPEERVEHVQIPGRSGDLTALEGIDIYNSYIQTATILVPGGYRVRDIYDWLRGSGYVTFSGEPDRRQIARIIGAITLNKHSHNLDWWTGEVQFYCQPLKELLVEETVTISSSGSTVVNRGDVPASPKITVTCSAGSTVVVTAGGNTLTVVLSDRADTGCIIDSEAMIVTTTDGTEDLTVLSSGNFPVLDVGSNAVTGSGWTSLAIDRRERYL